MKYKLKHEGYNIFIKYADTLEDIFNLTSNYYEDKQIFVKRPNVILADNKTIKINYGSYNSYFQITRVDGKDIKKDYMSYMCIKRNKECDGCQECLSESSKIICSECNEVIYDGDIYYDFENTIICSECIDKYIKVAQ